MFWGGVPGCHGFQQNAFPCLHTMEKMKSDFIYKTQELFLQLLTDQKDISLELLLWEMVPHETTGTRRGRAEGAAAASPSMGINHVAHSGEMWVLPAWILAKLTTLTLAGPTDELCESTAALLTRASTHHYRPGSSCSSLVKPPSDPRQHRAPSSWSTPSCSLLWAQGLKIRAAAIILSLLSYHWKQTKKKKKTIFCYIRTSLSTHDLFSFPFILFFK